MIASMESLRASGFTLDAIAVQFGVTRQAVWSRLNRQKANARAAVFNAVARGDLIRPTICPKCNQPGDIQGHHHDYSKPLDVQWLCRTCHRDIPVPRGSYGKVRAQKDYGCEAVPASEAARLLSIDRTTLWRLTKVGQVAALKTGRRARIYSLDELRRFTEGKPHDDKAA